MSDEIKVNSENTLPRKNLATLGQVKDALDKRDEKISNLTENVANVKNDIYLKCVSKEVTTHVGAYLTDSNKIHTQQGSQFIVETYEVTKGENVIISGSAKLYSSDYLLCAFSSEQFADGLSVEPIKNGSTTLTEYRFVYTAVNDGYIHCARVKNNGSVKVYKAEAPIKQIEPLTSSLNNKIINDTDLEYSDYENSFINAKGSINNLGNSKFHVLKFAVEANKCYKIYGNRVAINDNTLPLASFSLSSFDGSTGIAANVIISGDGQSAVANDYDVDYGLLYCIWLYKSW